MCATFQQPNAIANVILITGWSETFLKYGSIIKELYERGFNVHTYDHQSQGLSGRWLSETQSTWVHSFEDYVDDFVFFVTLISRESQPLPLYLFAHSMGKNAYCAANLNTFIFNYNVKRRSSCEHCDV